MLSSRQTSPPINCCAARLAKDINLLQSVYTFCDYYCQYPSKFTDAEVLSWLSENNNLRTNPGRDLFSRLITSNPDFQLLYSIAQKEEDGENGDEYEDDLLW